MNYGLSLKSFLVSLLASALVLNPLLAAASDAKAGKSAKLVEIAPRSGNLVAGYTKDLDREPQLSNAKKLALLRQNVKYVFVLFQENRSFDFHFGTYPGANGLFSQPAFQTPGFYQQIVNQDGSVSTVSPFLIPQSVVNQNGQSVLLYPEDTDSVNHSHTGINAKLDFNANWVAQNDLYSFTQEGLSGTLANGVYTGPAPTLAQKQMGELVISHIDCNTVPFLWNYADRFTLFDNFFDTVIGPSTPNAIAMISGQSGVTQWVKYPALGLNYDTNNSQLPVVGDPQPFWGSALDVYPGPGQSQPTESGGAPSSNPSSNLTFASLPLTFMGNQVVNITNQDAFPAFDLIDIQKDIKKIAGENKPPVPWAWYQEGYDLEPTDPNGTPTHATYIAHHNGPQYFGYEANNAFETQNHLKGLADFFNAINAVALPGTGSGGVYYIRGGYGNNDGLVPRSPSPAVEANFPGSDDHPGYSDAQIAEALLADEINAIANSPYWPQSAIIITYDETDGLYDHTQPAVRSWDPLGAALDQGPRIPAIVISPYGVVHGVSHEASEHGSIIKFIDQLFNLTPLANLPEEVAAQKLGLQTYGQAHLDPSDGKDTPIGALFSGFDNGRLLGTTPPLPPSYATIPEAQVLSLPHWGGNGCRILQITPTDYVNGQLIDPAPADFNPRPNTNPGLPTQPGWPTN